MCKGFVRNHGNRTVTSATIPRLQLGKMHLYQRKR